MAFSGSQPLKAYARANLTAYLSVPPTDWEPAGYNTTGTAPYYIVHTLGWTPTSIMGNVGIGDGSTFALNNSSNQDVNYTANNFMAADMSMQPWDHARITSPGGISSVSPAATESTIASNNTSTSSNNTTSSPENNTTAESNGLNIPSIGSIHLNFPQKISFDNNTSEAANNASEQSNQTSNQNTANSTGGVSFSRPLQDPYHPISMGRPVDDLLYEYPLSTSVTMYARLVGLPMPCGSCANIGIRCLGYGY
jgi:hypothetical protein